MSTIRPIMVVPPSRQHSAPMVNDPSQSFRPIMVVPPSVQESSKPTVNDPSQKFRPIMVVPHAGSRIPAPEFVAPRATPSVHIPEPKFMDPTRGSRLTNRVTAFFSVERTPAQLIPANIDSYPSFNVSPWNEFGVTRTAYKVNGELWVKCAPTGRSGKASWYDLGRA